MDDELGTAIRHAIEVYRYKDWVGSTPGPGASALCNAMEKLEVSMGKTEVIARAGATLSQEGDRAIEQYAELGLSTPDDRLRMIAVMSRLENALSEYVEVCEQASTLAQMAQPAAAPVPVPEERSTCNACGRVLIDGVCSVHDNVKKGMEHG